MRRRGWRRSWRSGLLGGVRGERRGEAESVKTRVLGTRSHALTVSAEGLGCMGMSEFYGTIDENEAVATISAALDAGVNFLDTADMYGPFTNERLVARAI